MYITAFPCNQFDLQEPGNNSEILSGIKYVRPGKGFEPAPHLHVYGKLEVNGRNAHPMYKFLKNACPPTGEVIGELKYYYWDQVRTSDIVWNFEKFIVDRQGRPRYRFHPGAWDSGKFVEQYLKTVLQSEIEDSEDDQVGFPAVPIAQSPTNFDVVRQDGIEKLHISSPSTGRPPTAKPYIPIPVPEPEHGRSHG